MIFGRHPTSRINALVNLAAGAPLTSNSDGAWSTDASVFDGSTSTGIRSYPADHCIVAGKDWGAGKKRLINRIKVQGHPVGGFCSSGFSPGDMHVYLFGSDTAPTFSANGAGLGQGVMLMSYGPFADTQDDTGVDVTAALASYVLTPYRYHWVGVQSPSFPYDMYISALNMWEIIYT